MTLTTVKTPAFTTATACKSALTGVGATMIYTGVVSFIILKVLDGIMGLRVEEDAEAEGLDLAEHGERGYII